MPWRISVWVCPPQTSMIVHGRVTVRAISSRRPRAIRSSRYSSTNLIAHSFRILRQVDALEVPHLGQERVLAGGAPPPPPPPAARPPRHRRPRRAASSRPSWRRTPPKSTVPIRSPCSSKTSITLPGTPRHIALPSAPRVGHDDLAEADTAVAGRHGGRHGGGEPPAGQPHRAGGDAK